MQGFSDYKIFQLGFVETDLNRAAKSWQETMGVGPFFTIPKVEDFTLSAKYYGEPAKIEFSVGLSYWKDRQIELIVPSNNSPSIYRDWLASGRVGLHHICVEIDDLEHARQLATAKGLSIAQEAEIAGGGGALYVDLGEDAPVRYVEFYQTTAATKEMYARMREKANTWDGMDLLRPIESA